MGARSKLKIEQEWAEAGTGIFSGLDCRRSGKTGPFRAIGRAACVTKEGFFLEEDFNAKNLWFLYCPVAFGISSRRRSTEGVF
jgi:hypothetical protein